MPIVLPKFGRAQCQQLTACSRLLTKEPALLRSFGKDVEMIAEAKQGATRLFVRMALAPMAHLHIDIARPSYFGLGNLPKPTHDWNEVQKMWERFLGEKIRLRGIGFYRLPTVDLPESGIIKFMSMESKSGSVGMKLTAGTFSITGAPVQRLKWILRNEGKKVQTELELRREQQMTELYLVDILKATDIAFDFFVRGHEQK